MKQRIHWFAILACLIASVRPAQAQDSAGVLSATRFRLYGNVDLGLLVQSQGRNRVAMLSGGNNNTYLGLDAAARVNDWFEAGVIAEAALALDSGTGASFGNLNNDQASAGSTCMLQGVQAPAACVVTGGGAQGVLFGREARLRLLLGRGTALEDQHRPGQRHHLSFGRYFTVLALNNAMASPIGLLGVGSPLALASAGQGATAVRLSNSFTYLSPKWLDAMSVQLQYALGEQSLGGAGDAAGLRLGVDHGGFHFGFAGQHTRLASGHQWVGNVGLLQQLGWFHVSALVQGTALTGAKPFHAMYYQLAAGAQWGYTNLELAVARLNQRRSADDALQFSAALRQRLGANLLLFLRGSYIRNRGQATYRSSGSETPKPGEDALVAVIGANLNF